jgi:hypothetical protein
MMDIVERLRGKKERVEIPCPDNIKGCAVLHFRLEVNPDCAEAAHEIERLREDKAELVEALIDMRNHINKRDWDENVSNEAKATFAKATGDK